MLEQQAAETAEQEKDEAELLDWYENRGGKDQKLHPMVEAELRVIRAKRNPPADNSPTPREQYEALSVAKPAEPIPAEVKQEQPEPLPVVELQSSKAYVSVSDTPGTLECIFRGMAITSPKSSRSVVRSDADHDSGLMPISNSI